MNGVSEKHHAHELIERLPDSQIPTAVRFLEFMLLVTDQDRCHFHDSQAYRGKGIPMEDVLAGFGFKSEDFPPNK